MDVGKTVRQYLKDNGITQKYISEKTGIKQNILSMTLNGKRKMQIDELERICSVTQKDPNYFIYHQSIA